MDDLQHHYTSAIFDSVCMIYNIIIYQLYLTVYRWSTCNDLMSTWF